MDTKPTHEQAQLHLQVYDLRREPLPRNPNGKILKRQLRDEMAEALGSRS